MANKIIKMTARIPIGIDEKLSEQSSKEMISKNALIVRACKMFVESLLNKEVSKC